MATYKPVGTISKASAGVRKYIANQHGYTIKNITLPRKRMPVQLRAGQIDLYCISDYGDVDSSGLLKAKYPTTVAKVYVYYNKSKFDWVPSWPPEGDFAQAVGKSKNRSTVLNAAGLNISMIQTTIAGIKMVHANRIDYFVDGFIPQTEKYRDILRTPEQGYQLHELFVATMSCWFNDDLKGRFFKKIIDDGYAELLPNEELFRKVYLTGHEPGYVAKRLDPYLSYMRENFPELYQ